MPEQELPIEKLALYIVLILFLIESVSIEQIISLFMSLFQIGQSFELVFYNSHRLAMKMRKKF